MARTTATYDILIASPGDITAEREMVHKAVHEWNATHSATSGIMLHDVAWQSHSRPEIGARPQELLNRQIVDRCDAVVGIFHTRIGTPTGVDVSGTVEEIRRLHVKGKEVMLYFSRAPKDPYETDDAQMQGVKAFRKEMTGKAVIHDYHGPENFRLQFPNDLAKLAEKWRSVKAEPTSVNHSPVPLTKEAIEVLAAMFSCRDTYGLTLTITGGLHVKGKIFIGAESLPTTGDVVTSTRYEDAVRQLVNGGYLRPDNQHSDTYHMTTRGIEVASQQPAPNVGAKQERSDGIARKGTPDVTGARQAAALLLNRIAKCKGELTVGVEDDEPIEFILGIDVVSHDDQRFQDYVAGYRWLIKTRCIEPVGEEFGPNPLERAINYEFTDTGWNEASKVGQSKV